MMSRQEFGYERSAAEYFPQMSEDTAGAANAAAAQRICCPHCCLQSKQAMQRIHLRNLRHLRITMQSGIDMVQRSGGTFC
jgi:hypothetical protein